ncbi:MAG: flap endonuclease-1 [Candidatus Micrarchaeia archaeon]
MGVDIGDLAIKNPVDFSSLYGKNISIDAFNSIYQFLASIRQPDGTPLQDFSGNITSHLSGLFYRTSKFLESGIKPIYVFDGKPPEFKKDTIKERIKNKKEAEEKWKKALEDERYEDAKKYAQATSRLTSEMVEECKTLLDGMGVPYIQAKSEGEAQSAIMAKKGMVYASASQDYDSLLFGAPLLLRNLSLTGRRKVPGKDKYILVEPEQISLSEVLEKNKITLEKLIWIGVLCGTDFNKGVRRVGPKTALKLVLEFDDFSRLKKHAEEKYSHSFETDPEKVIDFFKNPPYLEVNKINFGKINENSIKHLLCEKHDFSEDRVERTISNLLKISDEISGQSKLDSWF